MHTAMEQDLNKLKFWLWGKWNVSKSSKTTYVLFDLKGQKSFPVNIKFHSDQSNIITDCSCTKLEQVDNTDN